MPANFCDFTTCNIQEADIFLSIASIFHILTERAQMDWHPTTLQHQQHI